MPTLKFINLGPVTETPTVSVAGNLYALQVEDAFGSLENRITKKTVFVFDLRRRYSLKRESREHSKKKPVPAPPPFMMETEKELDIESEMRDEVDQVYFIDLVGNREEMDPENLRHLFPRADISNAPKGTSNWHHVRARGNCPSVLNAIDTIEGTGWTEASEKATVGCDIGIGPFEIFLFPSKKPKRAASVLVAGETNGRPFDFFLGNPLFKRVFPNDWVRQTEPMSRHILSAGTWRAFYAVAESKSLPVKVTHKGT